MWTKWAPQAKARAGVQDLMITVASCSLLCESQVGVQLCKEQQKTWPCFKQLQAKRM